MPYLRRHLLENTIFLFIFSVCVCGISVAIVGNSWKRCDHRTCNEIIRCYSYTLAENLKLLSFFFKVWGGVSYQLVLGRGSVFKEQSSIWTKHKRHFREVPHEICTPFAQVVPKDLILNANLSVIDSMENKNK